MPRRLFAIAMVAMLIAGNARLSSSALQDHALQITNADGKTTSIDAKMLKALPRQKAEIKDPAGKTVVYEGVALATLLDKGGISLEKDLKGARLANYLLVEAKDGYRVVFALPELAPANTDQLVLLADTKDGKALDEKEGPYRILVPHEKQHGRWIRQVAKMAEMSAPKGK